jgi:hypothetical protein
MAPGEALSGTEFQARRCPWGRLHDGSDLLRRGSARCAGFDMTCGTDRPSAPAVVVSRISLGQRHHVHGAAAKATARLQRDRAPADCRLSGRGVLVRGIAEDPIPCRAGRQGPRVGNGRTCLQRHDLHRLLARPCRPGATARAAPTTIASTSVGMSSDSREQAWSSITAGSAG